MIPNLPPYYDMFWSTDDGKLTVDANLYMDETFQTLDDLVTEFNSQFDNGLEVPNKNTFEIGVLEPNSNNGTLWFNTDISKLQVKTSAGVVETITST